MTRLPYGARMAQCLPLMDGTLTAKEIAAQTGADINYLRTLASTHGLQLKCKKHPDIAAGAVKGNQRQLSVLLDTETFAQVSALAKKEGVTVTQQLRLLIEWGLEAGY